MQNPVILVDGSSYLFRAFFALPELTSSKGEPTGAILGIMNMLRRLLKEHPSETIAVVFDTKSPNFRHRLFPDYKANRAKMPEALALQIEPIHRLIRLLGLPVIAVEGVEADDVIGTLTERWTREGRSVLIATGDKDMAQLIHEHVEVIDTMKNVRIDRAFVVEKFGVQPEQMVDYLALVGDVSDNIPGIPKVGPKTAAKWLAEYGSLDQIVAHAAEITGAVGESLRANLARLPISRQLVTIVRDVPLTVTLADLQVQPQQREALIEELKRFEMHSWLKEIAPNAEATTARSQTQHYECITTPEQWQRWQALLSAAPRFAVDTETTSLDAQQARLVGVSFALETGEAAYLPLGHDYLGVPEQLPWAQTLAELKVILENPTLGKIGQNLKYDVKVLARHGIELKGIVFDTMLASYVLDAGLGLHNMDALAKKHLGIDTIHYEDVAGKGAKQISFSQVSLDRACAYAAEDAEVTLKLYQHFAPRLAAVPALQTLFDQEEMPMLAVLARMEQTGVLLDLPGLRQQSIELAAEMQRLEREAFALAGSEFNLSSPKQLLEILYTKLQLPILKKTPGGQPSTDEEVLQELAVTYPLPRVLLDYRHLSKLKSTYTDKLPQMVDPVSGRVHTSYHQAVTSTGRLSSSDPNLQNIPIRSEVGRKIRKAFIAPPGQRIMAADYSQIELRIMAHLSQDPGLLSAFANHEDVHRATAAEVFAVPKEQVTTEQRRRAKAINFGLIYGMSAFGLARQLGINREEAQLYVKVYFERYPGVLAYMERTKRVATEQGFIETVFGRRLYLPELAAKNGMNRKAAERTAINAPMQGTAADIIKRAMITIDQALRTEALPARMVMQVHDELVFEVAEEAVATFGERVKTWMSGAAELAVPLVVDVGVGGNWDEAH